MTHHPINCILQRIMYHECTYIRNFIKKYSKQYIYKLIFSNLDFGWNLYSGIIIIMITWLLITLFIILLLSAHILGFRILTATESDWVNTFVKISTLNYFWIIINWFCDAIDVSILFKNFVDDQKYGCQYFYDFLFILG